MGEKSPKAEEVGAVFRVTVTGDGGGVWTVNLKDAPGVTEGDSGDSEVQIQISAASWEVISNDPSRAMEVFIKGGLKITGDPMRAAALFEIIGAKEDKADDPLESALPGGFELPGDLEASARVSAEDAEKEFGLLEDGKGTFPFVDLKSEVSVISGDRSVSSWNQRSGQCIVVNGSLHGGWNGLGSVTRLS